MWPFQRQPSNREVIERLESLERRFKTLLADVDEYFQLVRRAENRITQKRAKLPVEVPQETEELVPGNAGDAPGTSLSMLSPRQKQIQQQILRRRAGAA